MKPVLHRVVLILLSAPVAAWAADASCSVSSLPLSLYMITQPAPGLAAGSSAILDVPREGKKVLAIFSSKELADAFLGKIADAPAHKMATNPFPRSMVRQFQKNGTDFILDPLSMTDGGNPISAEADTAPEAKDNQELKTICDEDQADRRPVDGKAMDWNAVGPRDAKRLDRVKELYHDGKMATGPDFFNAALVLQHGKAPEDYLLAHDFALVAVSKDQGGKATWLAAASEDRFLMAIGRKQRFGTQMTDPIIVDGAITDHLREALDVPPLEEAEEQAKSLNPQPRPNPSANPAPSSVTTPAAQPSRQP
jgi:hypothetical protein